MEQYISDSDMLRREFGAWRAKTLMREASIVRRLKAPGRILDVGCAGGEFLARLKSEGWRCYGVEPSHVAAEGARRRGIQVYQAVLREADIRMSRYFDVVTYLDALYFSPTPREDLAKIHSLLKDDGFLIIELPGFMYRILRNVGPISLITSRRWCRLGSMSPHMFYFSLPSISKLLQKVGFKIDFMRLEQSPLRGSPLLQGLNHIYFGFSRALFALSLEKISLAAKEVYVCSKIH